MPLRALYREQDIFFNFNFYFKCISLIFGEILSTTYLESKWGERRGGGGRGVITRRGINKGYEYAKGPSIKSLSVSFLEMGEAEIPKSLLKILRPYQKHGFRWLKVMDSYGFGGILADDMGLGKTLQVITLLLSEKETAEKKETSLIVCPASLIYNWDNVFSGDGYDKKGISECREGNEYATEITN